MNHVSRRNRNNGLADAVDRFPLFGKTQFLIANVKNPTVKRERASLTASLILTVF